MLASFFDTFSILLLSSPDYKKMCVYLLCASDLIWKITIIYSLFSKTWCQFSSLGTHGVPPWFVINSLVKNLMVWSTHKILHEIQCILNNEKLGQKNFPGQSHYLCTCSWKLASQHLVTTTCLLWVTAFQEWPPRHGKYEYDSSFRIPRLCWGAPYWQHVQWNFIQ